jgi:hypothetical protein
MERPLIHTYRDPDFESRYFGPGRVVGYFFCWLVCSFVVFGFIVDRLNAHPWTAAAVSVGAVLILLIVQRASYRHHHYGICSEIRLSDEGICELETKRRVIRVHVNEIQSVRFSPETSEQGESYTIRYRGGRLDVGARRMTGFADFLTRLKALNPAADLSSFPAGWPNEHEEDTGVGNFGSVVFPLIVIIFLALIAWHTLSS